MKIFYLTALILCFSFTVSSQSDLDKLAATERSFAKTALDKGTRSAFLEFMSGDAIVFVPERTVAKPYWTGRPESQGALIWAPNFGDVSSNGILGYTTGNWEFRAKGKSDEPSAFGNFVTVWLRQPSGQYRWVVDIGVTHAKPDKYTEDFSGPLGPNGGNPDKLSAADSANRFFEMAGRQGAEKAYAAFATEDIRFFRENELPAIGRSKLIDRIKKSKGAYTFPKRSVFFETADLAYVNNSYTFASEKGSVETGNFLQIWKFVGGKWRIVLDIFKPVPAKTS